MFERPKGGGHPSRLSPPFPPSSSRLRCVAIDLRAPLITIAPRCARNEHPEPLLRRTSTSSALFAVSGILLKIPRPPPPLASAASYLETPFLSSVLLDCGEGTLNQLYRRFGGGAPDAPTLWESEGGSSGCVAPAPFSVSLRNALASIHIIWISHKHADHHVGILNVIRARFEALRQLRRSRAADAAAAPPAAAATVRQLSIPPVLIVGPPRVYEWLLATTRLDAAPEGAPTAIFDGDVEGGTPSDWGLRGQWRFIDAEHFVHLPSMVTAAATGLGGGAGETASASSTSSPHAALISEAIRLQGSKSARPSDAAHLAVESPCKQPRVQASSAASCGLSSDPTLDSLASADVPAAAAAAAGPGGGHSALADAVLQGPGSAGSLVSGCASNADPILSFNVSNVDFPVYGMVPLSSDAATSAASSTSPAAETGGLHLASPDFVRDTLAAAGVAALRTVRVRHCQRSYAIRIEAIASSSVGWRGESASGCGSGEGGGNRAGRQQGWSLVYSGDTRPCQEVVALALGCSRGGLKPADAGQFAALCPPSLATADAPSAADGCSILIHEATFESDEGGAANARDKNHSTVDGACAVAAASGAAFTILTHFSAKYPKTPVLLSPSSGNSAAGEGVDAMVAHSGATKETPPPPPSVFVAYDWMTVRGCDLMGLPSLLPALHAMFAEEDGEDEEGAAGRVIAGE